MRPALSGGALGDGVGGPGVAIAADLNYRFELPIAPGILI
jgi:hypothetical protein